MAKYPRVVLETPECAGEWALRIVEYDNDCYGPEQRGKDLMGRWAWGQIEDEEDFLIRLKRSLSAARDKENES